jgi:hypothetical protein
LQKNLKQRPLAKLYQTLGIIPTITTSLHSFRTNEGDLLWGIFCKKSKMSQIQKWAFMHAFQYTSDFCSRAIGKKKKSDAKFWNWLRQSWTKILATPVPYFSQDSAMLTSLKQFWYPYFMLDAATFPFPLPFPTPHHSTLGKHVRLMKTWFGSTLYQGRWGCN